MLKKGGGGAWFTKAIMHGSIRVRCYILKAFGPEGRMREARKKSNKKREKEVKC